MEEYTYRIQIPTNNIFKVVAGMSWMIHRDEESVFGQNDGHVLPIMVLTHDWRWTKLYKWIVWTTSKLYLRIRDNDYINVYVHVYHKTNPFLAADDSELLFAAVRCLGPGVSLCHQYACIAWWWTKENIPSGEPFNLPLQSCSFGLFLTRSADGAEKFLSRILSLLKATANIFQINLIAFA